MNLQNLKYIKNERNENNAIYAESEGKFKHCIPCHESNRTYTEIMQQVEAGELTIAPADEEE